MNKIIAPKEDSDRVSLLILGIVSFIVMADMRVIDPLLRVIADDFHTSVGNAAAVISAYTLPYGLFQLVYGPLGDRMGKLQVMTRALVVFAIGTALCAFMPNLPLLVLMRFLTGVFAAAIIPLTLAYIGDSFPYAERQTAIGRYLSALMLGQILSSSLGGIFGEFLSWRDIFLFFGIASSIIAAIFWQSARQVTARHPQPIPANQPLNLLSTLKPYWKLISIPSARIIITTVFIEGFFLFGSFAYIGAYIRDRHGLPYLTIGILLSGFGIGGLIYSLLVKSMVRRLGEKGLVLIGGSLVGICFLSLTFIYQWMFLIPETIAIGLGFYMIHSTLQTQATEISPESRGTAVSLFAFSLFLGQGIGAGILGLIVDRFGYIPVFIVSGISVPLLAYWFALQFKHLKQR